MTDATQALLPVTQADKDLYSVILNLPETNRKRRLAGEPIIECVQLLAAHSQAHSLPGDVGTAGMKLAREIVAADLDDAIQYCDADWEGMSRTALEAIDAALTPSALSGDAGEVEPFPGCYADLQQRRVTTLAKLGLMLSVMASGDAPEVVGYDAAELYAEVLMALAIEDAEDTDIALEIVRDHPEADILAGHRISCPPVTEEAEKVAAWLEQYPSPMNDLDMAMRIRQICARIRAGAHRKSDATPSGEAGEEKPNGVAENKAGGLWYRRWYTAQTRVNELEALLANPPKHKFWGAGEPDCPREIKAPNGELHTLRCKVCGLDNPRNDLCRAALPSHKGAGE